MLPELVSRARLHAGKAPGYQADDFLAASHRRREEALAGVRVTSDRDRSSSRRRPVTILTPTRGVSELARIGPDQVARARRRRAEAGAGLHRAPGRPVGQAPGRPGVGPKGRRRSSGVRHARKPESGRIRPYRRGLRLYRRIATLDASAPLPPLEDQSPLWAEASSLLSRWGMNQMAERLAGRAELAHQVFTHPDQVRLHPTGHHRTRRAGSRCSWVIRELVRPRPPRASRSSGVTRPTT